MDRHQTKVAHCSDDKCGCLGSSSVSSLIMSELKIKICFVGKIGKINANCLVSMRAFKEAKFDRC